MTHLRTTARRTIRTAASLLCLLAVVFLAMPSTAVAEEQGKTVRVGWYESPFNQTDRYGRRFGYAYEYQRKIAAYTGWDYEYVEGSWPDLMEMLQRGEIDLLSDVSYTDERVESMLFSTLPMGAEEYYVFVATGNADIVPDRTSSLDGKTVGVNKDSFQAGLFDEWEKSHGVRADILELTCSEEESLQMLQDGRLDAYVTLDVFGDSDVSVPVWKVGSSDIYFALAKGRTDLLNELDAAMSKIQTEDRYYEARLYEKYVVPVGANVFLGSEESAWLSDHSTIRVAYQDDHLAFCDEEDGELTGALKDYLDMAADCLKNAHLDFEPVAYPTVAAALEAVRNGEADCMFPANLRETDGEELGLVPTPAVMSSEVYALVRTADKAGFQGKSDVKVAVVSDNSNYDALLKDHFPDWQPTIYPDASSCLHAVAAGEVDCVLVSNYRYNSLSGACERLNLTPVATGADIDYGFAVRTGDVELYTTLAKVIGLVPTSAVSADLTRYYSEETDVSLSDFVRANPVVVIGVLAVVLALVVANVAMMRALRAEREARERERQVEDLSGRVFVDPLTSVRNKAGFDRHAEGLEGQMASPGGAAPFAIAVLDCDGLKEINDQHGHGRGDDYLKAACRLICVVFSHSPVFRIGGDEFVVVLQNDDYQKMYALVEEFDREQEVACASAANPWDEVRVSMGVAVYNPATDHSVDEVLKRADKAMYESKLKRKKGQVR